MYIAQFRGWNECNRKLQGNRMIQVGVSVLSRAFSVTAISHLCPCIWGDTSLPSVLLGSAPTKLRAQIQGDRTAQIRAAQSGDEA